ncbi:glycosyltransferase [Teichococcus aestuarii]|uniref:glycosyltransferase n=1 Tax=Teichococcus aestuarii TaxID=568898 RepID=UPI0011B1E1E6|nr:glycosyltransferase [Pseudoroseomonas aestuarii]
MKLVGIHDYTMTAPMFIDPNTSLSWLRAFERLSAKHETHAFLREKNYDRSITGAINGIYYHFHTPNLNNQWRKIADQKPDLVFFNLCDFNGGFDGVAKLRNALPEAVFLIRFHHEPQHLFRKSRFLEILYAMDAAIVPMDFHKEDLKSARYFGDVYAAPFGVDWKDFATKARPFGERYWDVVSAVGPAPQKNTAMLKEVFSILEGRGYKTKNFGGLSKDLLSSNLEAVMDLPLVA